MEVSQKLEKIEMQDWRVVQWLKQSIMRFGERIVMEEKLMSTTRPLNDRA